MGLLSGGFLPPYTNKEAFVLIIKRCFSSYISGFLKLLYYSSLSKVYWVNLKEVSIYD